MTKPLTFFSVTLLLLAVGTKANAQAIGYSNFGRNFSNQVFSTNMMNNMMRMSAMTYSNHMSSDNKIYFDFMLKNSRRRLSTASKIYMDSIKRKTYIVYDDITLRDNDPRKILKIYPFDLQSISIKNDNARVFQPQLTTDSCWMFKAIKGEITVYSNGLAPVALQQHDGTIQQFNKNILLSIINDDKAAMELYNKGEYIEAIQKYNRNYKKIEDKAYDDAHRVN